MNKIIKWIAMGVGALVVIVLAALIFIPKLVDMEQYRPRIEQQVAKARGEAESLKMQREAVTPQLIELRKVEAEIKAIDKWNGVLPIYTGSAIPFLSINDSKLNNGK